MSVDDWISLGLTGLMILLVVLGCLAPFLVL